MNRELAGQFLRDLGSGKVDAAHAVAGPAIDKAALDGMSKKMVAAGGVQDVTTPSTLWTNGVIELKGVVRFGTGQNPYEMQQQKINDQWKVTYFKIGD